MIIREQMLRSIMDLSEEASNENCYSEKFSNFLWSMRFFISWLERQKCFFQPEHYLTSSGSSRNAIWHTTTPKHQSTVGTRLKRS